jgi:hypothetical protein
MHPVILYSHLVHMLERLPSSHLVHIYAVVLIVSSLLRR